MSVIHFEHYRISPINPTGDEKEITISSNDERGYGISVRQSIGSTPHNYTIYPPNEQRKIWTVGRLGHENPEYVRDPNLLWSVLPLEQTSKKIDPIAGGVYLTTVSSVALLACKLLGWIKVGHWGLYLAGAAISVIAINYFGKKQAVTQFDIANRIYSVLDLADNKVQEINAQSKFLLKPSDYVITGPELMVFWKMVIA